MSKSQFIEELYNNLNRSKDAKPHSKEKGKIKPHSHISWTAKLKSHSHTFQGAAQMNTMQEGQFGKINQNYKHTLKYL